MTEPASTAFYDLLFDRAPQLRSLFREDIAGQGMRFMSTLGTILAALDRPEDLDDELTRLAESHAAIGIEAGHFEPMGKALIETFDLTLGDDFTSEVEEAWTAAYDLISREMIARGKMG